MQKIRFIITTVVAIFIFSGCGNSYVDSVKNGVLPKYSNSVTVGNALEYWAKQQNCDSTKWEEFETEREEIVVSFTCTISSQNDSFINVAKSQYSQGEKNISESIERVENAKVKLAELISVKNPDIFHERHDLPDAKRELLRAEENLLFNINRFESWKEQYIEIHSQFNRLEYIFQC